MNKSTSILLALLLPLAIDAQVNSWTNTINNKIKSKAVARVDNKIDHAIEQSLDIAERKMADTSDTGNQVYTKYDFVPGEQIIFYNDLSQEVAGELPAGWNSNGNAAVVTLNEFQGNWLQLYQNSTYLTNNEVPFTANFTIEFDLIMRRANPKAAFPELVWGVLSSGGLSPTHNNLLTEYAAAFTTELRIQPSDAIRSTMQLQTLAGRNSYLKTAVKNPGSILVQFNQIVHISMQVQKERLRIWFNGEKLYDLPKAIAPEAAINQLYFNVKRYGGSESEVGYLISNIKIAKGLADTRNKLLNEGRFSTTGIRFKSNSHALLPESNGIMKEIAQILSSNHGLHISIIGHTDNDGAEDANLGLSQKRANAVKQALVVEHNIEASRIACAGAGEAQPIADNGTAAGKASNRRVEFIKQ